MDRRLVPRVGAGQAALGQGRVPIMTILVLAIGFSSMQLGILIPALDEAPDIELAIGPDELARAPDVILASSASGEEEARLAACFDRWPSCRVLSLGWRGAWASLLELRSFRSELGQLDRNDLVDRIRSTAARPALFVDR
jgi:hypothetical protein